MTENDQNSDNGLFCLEDAAMLLKIQHGRLNNLLLASGWIVYDENLDVVPTQAVIDGGCMVVVPTECVVADNGKGDQTLKAMATRVTQDGMELMHDIFGRFMAERM